MLLSEPSVDNDIVNDLLFVVVILLGNQDVLRTVRDTAPERDITRMAAHDLDDTASLVRG